MLWALLFVCSAFAGKPDVHQLKKEWKHKDYASFDHYWNATFDTDPLRPMTTVMKLIEERRIVCVLEGECPTVIPSIIGQRTNCVNGNAGGYPCNGIDLLSFVSLSDLGSGSNADGNDIWGYTDGAGRRYAITGQTDGASIVDVTDPVNPEVLVWLESQREGHTLWRDMKVYKNYVYIVADASRQYLQYVNLDEIIARARAQSARPLRITRGDGDIGLNLAFSWCHNIALNTETGFAYTVGTNLANGGLYSFNVQNGAPVFAGQFPNDGYTHDVECVTYRGPQATFEGNEICFAYNENSFTIVDMSNKNSPTMLSRSLYPDTAYTHQGWVTDDHRYVLMNDELDEAYFDFNTRTIIWDVTSLTSPQLLGYYMGPTPAIDHNLYIDGNLVFESNYRAGLRVLDIRNIANAELREVAYFDTYPENNNPSFDGAWSNYPYFDDIVIVQDINRGLFVLSKPAQPTGPLNSTVTA